MRLSGSTPRLQSVKSKRGDHLPEPEPESEPELPESEPEPESEAVGKKEEQKEVEEDLLLELPTFHVTRHPEHWVCFAQTSRSCCRTTIQFTQAHLGHRHKAQRHNTASKDTEVLNLLLFCTAQGIVLESCWSLMSSFPHPPVEEVRQIIII